MTIKDIMGDHTSAEIRCMYTGQVARRLTVNGDMLHMDAITEAVDVPMDTKLDLQPWVFDRGSIVFDHPLGRLKFCGEGDPITFEDGSEYRVGLGLNETLMV